MLYLVKLRGHLIASRLMFVGSSTRIGVLAITMLPQGKGFSMFPKLISLPALAGLLSVSGVLALMMALGMEDGSKVVPIGRLSLILTAILSIIILREPLPAIKLAGLGFGSRSPMVTQSILIITVR